MQHKRPRENCLKEGWRGGGRVDMGVRRGGGWERDFDEMQVSEIDFLTERIVNLVLKVRLEGGRDSWRMRVGDRGA